MKYVSFLLSFFIAAVLVFILNRPLGAAPALGKFFSPFDGFWQNAESTTFSDETYYFDGLKDSVEVVFDKRLVPHVFAKNEQDLLFMQGYLTAKYRLWQMEIQTHNAAGRVSEIVGEKALDNDRLQRRIGLEFGAEKAEKLISQDETSSALLTAYCAGVNTYIKSLSPKDYPLEYKLLSYAPEEWKPIKVALLLKNMANMLSVFEYDIENTNFIAKYGEDEFKHLYDEYDDFTDFIIPKGTSFDFKAIDGFNSTIKNQIISDKNQPTAYNNALEKPDEITGSNNWAVGGAKTKSGKPILCNDPHLALNLPSIWYEMHLVAPGINVYGATLPGAPCVISGFNDSIAWGVTNGGRDVRDWFSLQFKDDSHDEYLVDGKWEKTDKKIEHFYIKNSPKEFYDTVLYTRYGPVVFDESFRKTKSQNLLALKWTAHQPSNEFKTFYLLNKGKNYDDYRAALTSYACPTQNFVFASRSNDIAIVQQGKHPNAKSVIADGSNSANDWSAYIPSEHNPSVKNPARGFVSSANQFPVDETYPYQISRVGTYEPNRAVRINRLLEENNNIDANFMKKMHSDNYNIFAEMLVPTLVKIALPLLKEEDDKQFVNEVATWNYFNNADDKKALLFEVWSGELDSLLWDEMLDETVPMKRPNHYMTARFLKLDS
ncbi:MAG TPA: penicillin acylase family protein, partial [Chitinophagales bacterium]